MEVAAHGVDKRPCADRDTDAAVENLLIGDVLAVVLFGIATVLVDDVTGEINACEDALATRVGEEAGVDGSGCCRVTAYGTGGYADVATELELVMQEMLATFARDGNEDEVGGLTASLKAEACAGDLDESRCAPAVVGVAGDYSLAILRADEEGTLLEAGDNGDAASLLGDIQGNAFVGGSHDLAKDGASFLDTTVKLGFIGSMGREGDGDKSGGTGYLQELFHRGRSLSCANLSATYSEMHMEGCALCATVSLASLG